MITTNLKDFQNKLTDKINSEEAKIEAFEKVAINTNHKTLTNKAILNGTIDDYLGIGKALYVRYTYNGRYITETLIAYDYTDEHGNELGVNGINRISRTISPNELQNNLDSYIAGMVYYLSTLKKDLANSKKIVTDYNNIIESLNKLNDSISYAAQSSLTK